MPCLCRLLCCCCCFVVGVVVGASADGTGACDCHSDMPILVTLFLV